MSTTLYSIAAGSYTGTLDIPAVVLPSALGGTFTLQVETSQWTDATSSVTVAFELSLDNGQTYVPYVSGLFQGGSLNAQGDPITEQLMGVLVPAGPVHMQGTITIVGTLITNGIAVSE